VPQKEEEEEAFFWGKTKASHLVTPPHMSDYQDF
jgi:hypothetical protein